MEVYDEIRASMRLPAHCKSPAIYHRQKLLNDAEILDKTSAPLPYYKGDVIKPEA
jgi:hypothetical protein